MIREEGPRPRVFGKGALGSGCQMSTNLSKGKPSPDLIIFYIMFVLTVT